LLALVDKDLESHLLVLAFAVVFGLLYRHFFFYRMLFPCYQTLFTCSNLHLTLPTQHNAFIICLNEGFERVGLSQSQVISGVCRRCCGEEVTGREATTDRLSPRKAEPTSHRHPPLHVCHFNQRPHLIARKLGIFFPGNSSSSRKHPLPLVPTRIGSVSSVSVSAHTPSFFVF